mgnify:CR=1 FL=1
MPSHPPKSSIDRTAVALRHMALDTAEGSLLGGEDELVGRLGVSKVTVRQAARLLEREGVLRVRRGLNGGYFAARPSIEMVEAVVCSYLNTMGLDDRYSGTVTTALWQETLRAAAGADRQAVHQLVEHWSAIIRGVPEVGDDAKTISRLEQELRADVLRLIEGEYVELLIRINVAFSRQKVLERLSAGQLGDRDPEHQRLFVQRWKMATLMELAALADGDPEFAAMAARHNRNVWNEMGEHYRVRTAQKAQ